MIINRMDWKKFRRDLHNIIELRDDFAHGLLHIDIGSGDIVLKYYRDGFRQQKITQGWLNSIHTCIEVISDQLFDIHQVISEKMVAAQYRPSSASL